MSSEQQNAEVFEIETPWTKRKAAEAEQARIAADEMDERHAAAEAKLVTLVRALHTALVAHRDAAGAFCDSISALDARAPRARSEASRGPRLALRRDRNALVRVRDFLRATQALRGRKLEVIR